MSFVSDISELSMLSDLRFDHLPRVPIAGVHGSSNVRVQIKRLNEQLAMVNFFFETTELNSILFTLVCKAEMGHLSPHTLSLPDYVLNSRVFSTFWGTLHPLCLINVGGTPVGYHCIRMTIIQWSNQTNMLRIKKAYEPWRPILFG